MTLHVLKYNNYYNRLVKSFDSAEDYEPYVIYTLEDTNFKPNDGVNTEHVIGVGDYNGEGDYIILTSNKRRPIGAPAGWEKYVVSRWFIIDSIRTAAG